jgi:hypothetical protein
MRGKRRLGRKATALAFLIASAALCAIPAVALAVPPDAPTGLALTPPGPANNNLPVLTGTAEAGSTVSVFDNGNCTGSVLGTPDAATFATPGLPLSVNDNSTNTFSANAANIDGPGDCSGPITYVEDSSGPSITGLTTNPGSPANNNDPVLKGSTEAGSTVEVFANGTCSPAASSSGSAATFSSAGLPVHVGDNTNNTLSARATDGVGNVGGCSTVNYTEDSIGPTGPSGLNTNPASPSNVNTPLLRGTPAGDAVSVMVYPNATCSLGPSDTGTPGEFSGTGLQVTVPSNTTTPISADSKDAAGNVGGCTTINYTEDSTGPAAPTALTTNPLSPSNNNNPFLKGTASGDSASVSVYVSADCTGTAVSGSPISPATFASTGLQVTVPSNAVTALSARATDGVGNTGACATINYSEDSTGPLGPTDLSTLPVSPANDNNPLFRGTAEAGSTVSVFTNASCTSSILATGPAATFAAPGLVVSVSDNTTTTFFARATDSLGNVGVCSSVGVNYVEDSTLPVAPRLLTTTPASGSDNNDPILKGVSDTGTTVAVFTNGTCSGHSFGGGSVAAFAAGFSFHVADNSVTHLSARATDVALNQSACSSPLDYSESTPGPPSSGVGGKKTSNCKKKSKSASTAKKKKHKNCKKHKKTKKKKKK